VVMCRGWLCTVALSRDSCGSWLCVGKGRSAEGGYVMRLCVGNGCALKWDVCLGCESGLAA